MGQSWYPKILVLSSVVAMYVGGTSMNKIELPTLQEQRLWDDPNILGSRDFNHPLSSGTYTWCDRNVMKRVFDEDFKLNRNYTFTDITWKNPATRATKWFIPNAAFKIAAYRRIRKGLYSVESCIMACIAEKEFVCWECDYYTNDGGICALYNMTGNYEDYSNPLYIGYSFSADHYRIYKVDNEMPSPCNISVDQQAYHSFALGWKAMECGWYELAHHQFSKAISIDSSYYMAYIGVILSSEYLGYLSTDSVIGNYNDKLMEISQQSDVSLRLTYPEQRLLCALSALHGANNFKLGLKKMYNILNNDTVTISDSVTSVLRAYAVLELLSSWEPLANVADTDHNVYAIQLLVRSLNPYGNGMNKTDLQFRQAALAAVYIYHSLEIDGSQRITLGCVDIAEYYGEWKLSKRSVFVLKNFLIRNVGQTSTDLLMERNGTIILQGLGVEYMAAPIKRVYEYERLHFYHIQLAEFAAADGLLRQLNSEANDEEKTLLLYRMMADAYFSTYDYIYDDYSKRIQFGDDCGAPLSYGKDDLFAASRAYYCTAAAVCLLRGGSDVWQVELIERRIAHLLNSTDEPFQSLISMYGLIVKATQQLRNSDFLAVIVTAQKVADIQSRLSGVKFSLSGYEDNTGAYRMLIPLGYQFRADTLREVYRNQNSALVTIDEVIAAYEQGLNTPPLNNSRLLKGYGDSLKEKEETDPQTGSFQIPKYIQIYERLLMTWRDTDTENFTTVTAVAASVDSYYSSQFTGCRGDVFEMRSEQELCWPSYMMICVMSAITVLFIIVIGMYRMHKKALPAIGKDGDKAFNFSGPTLCIGGESSGNSQLSTFERERLQIRPVGVDIRDKL